MDSDRKDSYMFAVMWFFLLWREMYPKYHRGVAMFFFGMAAALLQTAAIYGHEISPRYAPQQWVIWSLAYLFIGWLAWLRPNNKSTFHRPA